MMVKLSKMVDTRSDESKKYRSMKKLLQSTKKPSTHKKNSYEIKNKLYDPILNEWVVERILKWNHQVHKYLVKWKGYKKATWEPKDNMDNCSKKAQEFFLNSFPYFNG